MVNVRARALAPAVLAALALTPIAQAGAAGDARAALGAVDRAEARGRIDAGDAERYRLVVRRAREELRLLPGTRGSELGAVLRQVASLAPSAGAARMRALMATLEQNGDYLGVRQVPVARAYVRDRAGVVYRELAGLGLQLHPLASFARLNAELARGDDVGAARLASALLAVGVSRRGALLWEYAFPFGGGNAPWTSGMAQAVAAQALARAGNRFGDPALLAASRRAYRAVPVGLLDTVQSGPWIRQYSFNDLVVLNAQLQAAISIGDYGSLADDAGASRLAVRMEYAAAALLPRFDTGYWSRYTVVGESSLGYHVYVVSLLQKLARRTGSSFWRDAAARFDRYTREAPRVDGRGRVLPLYPWPADGFRDRATISFWLSKRSAVTVRIGSERRDLALGQGVHSLTWSPPGRAAGTFPCRVFAVDLAGNRSTTRLPDVRVLVDRRPPHVVASLRAGRLAWHAVDRGTPSLRFHLRFARPGRHVLRKLGDRMLRGTIRVRIPKGRWHAALFAWDTSGNRARVPLGDVAR